VFIGYYLNVCIQSSDPRLHLQDGHDEASGSSSEVDDTTETKVLVLTSSSRTPALESIVSETELLLRTKELEHFVNGVVWSSFFLNEHAQ
jgi:hypothetical protein